MSRVAYREHDASRPPAQHATERWAPPPWRRLPNRSGHLVWVLNGRQSGLHFGPARTWDMLCVIVLEEYYINTEFTLSRKFPCTATLSTRERRVSETTRVHFSLPWSPVPNPQLLAFSPCYTNQSLYSNSMLLRLSTPLSLNFGLKSQNTLPSCRSKSVF
jgi:hypothetical protein